MSDPEGIDCTITAGAEDGDCTEEFVRGTSVALTATEQSGSEFIGWSNPQCAGGPGGQCTLTMDADMETDAQFDLLAPEPPPVCAGDPRWEFTDTDFDAADWTEVDFFDTTPGMAADVDASQQTNEGNPAPSRSIKHSYCGVGGMIVGHWNTANTFDPGGVPANFVSIAFDARMFPWVAGSAEDMVLRTLIKQGNSFYERGAIEVEAGDLQWMTNAHMCLTSNGFNKQTGSDPNDPEKPDFSQPMQFGFTTANSSPNAGACVVDREALLDNFSVEVR